MKTTDHVEERKEENEKAFKIKLNFLKFPTIYQNKESTTRRNSPFQPNKKKNSRTEIKEKGVSLRKKSK